MSASEAYFGSARSSGTTWAARHGRLHLPRPLSAFADRLLLLIIAHPMFRDELIVNAEKQGIWIRSNKR